MPFDPFTNHPPYKKLVLQGQKRPRRAQKDQRFSPVMTRPAGWVRKF